MSGKLSNIVRSTKAFIYDHNPAILTSIGITGMIMSTILAVKVTPKALILIENKKRELTTEELTIKETISITWKIYLPVVITSVASASCLIGACSVNSKRNAALTTAYTLSEKAYTTYRDQVIRTIGEKKEKNLRAEIAQENVNNKPVDKGQIILTQKGNTLCKDSISGRYFRSDLDTIRKIMNELNRKMLIDNSISLNEYYSAIGLDNVKDGDYMGWSVDSGLIELNFDACIANDDEPCIVVDYNIIPFKGYNIYS